VKAPGWPPPPPGWQGQGQWLGDPGWTPEQKRATMVQIARACVGIRFDEPRYLELCYPHDDPAVAAGMAQKQHGCAHVAGGLLRCFGFDHYELSTPAAWAFAKSPPRRPVDPMVRLQVMGGFEHKSRLPIPGEIAIIGTGLLTHALTVVEVGEHRITSVDGGFRCAIHETERSIVRSNGKVYLADGLGPREIIGVLRVGELVPHRMWMLPRESPQTYST